MATRVVQGPFVRPSKAIPCASDIQYVLWRSYECHSSLFESPELFAPLAFAHASFRYRVRKPSILGKADSDFYVNPTTEALTYMLLADIRGFSRGHNASRA